jgi:glutathione S-transferase
MDEILRAKLWLVGERLTLADLACYAYVAHAPEGGVDLAPFEHVRNWLARIEAQDFFSAMDKTKAGLWA